MTISFLKKADKSPTTGQDNTNEIVSTMLKEIEAGGEQKALEYAAKLDNWGKDVVVTKQEIKEATASLSEQDKADIRFSHARVKEFAEAQLASMTEFEKEISPGLICGQKLIPVQITGDQFRVSLIIRND